MANNKYLSLEGLTTYNTALKTNYLIDKVPDVITVDTNVTKVKTGTELVESPALDDDSAKIATTHYVQYNIKNITSAMVFKGGVTAAASGDASNWTFLDEGYLEGNCIWTDDENIYYSNGSDQYVLNKSTFTWTEKTWTGLTSFGGYDVWTDDENIYYSNESNQYVLDKSTSTWNTKTWNGLTNFGGEYTWTDGANIYYSVGTAQYVLNKATSTWTAKSWTGLTDFNGNNVWTDGENIYYSNDASAYGTVGQYILDKSTSTWSAKTWTGLTSLRGVYIWTDGENIYYSAGNNQYVLNKSTSTWTAKTWTGYTSLYGDYIWTDGENIYYYDGNAGVQYILDKPITTLTLADATLGAINAGYTFKFTANETGGSTFKLGDIIIANEDITHTAGATITYDSAKWTVVPSGDDVDVTAVTAGTGLQIGDGTGSQTITQTGTINLKPADTSTIGGVSVASTSAISNSSGAIDVKIDNVTIKQDPEADYRLYVVPASRAEHGVVRPDGDIITCSGGDITVATATDSAKGVVQVGTNIDVSSGTISVKTGSANDKGVLQVGTNLDVAGGVISVKTGSTTDKGVLSVGDYLKVDNGVVSVPLATTTSAGTPNFGVVQTGTNITNTSGVISVETATANPTGATSGVLGVVKGSVDNGVLVEDGVLSIATISTTEINNIVNPTTP